MKLRSTCSFCSSGVALVLVLGILVLLTGLVVAFLSLSTTERKSAAVFLTNSSLRQIADNAVGIVQAQVNQATTSGPDVAWASQPGMIRTYTASGSLNIAYKLYSAPSLTESDPANIAGDVPPETWAGSPAIWTDLNAPVNANGKDIYPILDPGLLDLPAAERPLGFAIEAAPGSSSAQRAPMPVRWLYVLKDGQIVAPTGSDSQATVPGASDTNPITGRIAFWTDDESCKVNLNTAGVGGYWDTPHFYTTEDRKFATSQPLNGEFQRYPGHPAMTSLSAVFPPLTDEQILSSLTPRYQWGGSKQGAVDTFAMTSALNGGSLANGPLYADTDEAIFSPTREARNKNSSASSDRLAKSKFFLTTNSRAPEVTLSNLPRVICWPVSTNPNGRTVFDNVIAFAGSIGSKPYFFQRQSALSATIDSDPNVAGPGIRNRDLFAYLRHITSLTVPGFGVDLASRFGPDRDQILTEIWDYIRSTNLYDTRLQSGNQFTADSNQAGTGYGYVVPLENGAARGMGRSITLSELAFVFICTADPVDTQTGAGHPNPKGMLGSNDPATNKTLSGAALAANQRRVQMMILPAFFSPSQGDVSIRPKYVRITISGLTSLTLGSSSLFSTASGTLKLDDVGFNTGHHRRFLGGAFDYRAVLRGISDPGLLDSGGTRYPFISQFVTVPVPNPGAANPGAMTFGAGPLSVTLETSANGSTWSLAQTIPVVPPASTAIPIPNLVRKGTVAGSGSPPSPTATSAPYWWAFSKASPMTGTSSGRFGVNANNFPNLAADPGNFTVSGGVPQQLSANSVLAGTLFREAEDASYYTDVVRSMGVSHGDLRLICGLRNVPNDAFTPIGDWSAAGAANALMHTLGTGVQTANTIPGAPYRRHFVTTAPIGPGGVQAPAFRTDTPAAVINAVTLSNDFDNGTAYWPDGPYINKPDEGNILGTGKTPYFANTEQEKILSIGFFSPNRVMAGPGMFGSLPTHIQRYAADSAHPENYAWRTLLFRKQPGHPNAVSVDSGGIPSAAPDHLLMDLFWMPTVEPYAISEQFSTDGKINMNYRIEPFPYIERKTGLYAVLQREKIAAVEGTAAAAAQYKSSIYPTSPQSDGPAAVSSYRLDIDAEKTLQQFDTRLADASGRIFLSPTELCDLWLVPAGQSVSGMETFWSNRGLTGDNMRERPYTTIIPRLTTKSNTFTVHYRAQTLKVPKGSPAGTWDETKGVVSGEYRGSTTIQRFIDPKLTVDFVVDTANQTPLDSYYRWRVLDNRQFAP